MKDKPIENAPNLKAFGDSPKIDKQIRIPHISVL